MAASASPPGASGDLSPEQRRFIDGIDRIPLLDFAESVIVGPPTRPDEPALVVIEWTGGRVERPPPGSTLWRAVIARELAPLESADDPPSRERAEQLGASLRRWPDLDTWWTWLRTGWLAPPR